jgi:single-strand DNA-binding protein
MNEGGPNALQLDLHPQTLVARLRSSTLHLELANVTQVTVSDLLVRLDAGDEDTRASVLLHPDGTLALTLSPRRPAPETAAQPSPSPTETSHRAPATQTEQERQNRVVYTGRLGRDPDLRTTAKGRQVAKTSLAVHEGEQTSWHTIIFFDERAVTAAETLHKGDLLTVVGYRHQREITRRDGTKRQVEEIYAAGVQPPKEQQQRP